MSGPNRGSQPEPRIDLSDSVQSAVAKLAEGNPGATRVCAELFVESRRMDPVGSLEGFAPLLSLDTLGIYGSDLWSLYKKPCHENAENLVAALRANQLGLLGADNVRQGQFDPEAVKQMVVKELGPKDFLLASASQEQLPTPAAALPTAFAHRPHPMSLDAVLAHKMAGLSAGRPSTLPVAFSSQAKVGPKPAIPSLEPLAMAPTVYQSVTQEQLATLVYGFSDLTAKKDVPVRALVLDQAQIDKINAEGGFKTVVIDENGNAMVETVNKSMLPGDYLVTNQIEGQDNSYIVTAAKFAKLYAATNDPGVFNPIGDPRTVFQLPAGVNLEFEAPWGGTMKIRSGGVLVPDGDKFYGINPEEFKATYRVV